jgi:uncharacterized caspase-like protein
MMRIALVLLLGLLLPPTALAEKRVALVIGIDKYDNLAPQAQLRKARSDGEAVAQTLRDLGFDVIAKDDVTRSAFNNYWQDFLNKLTPGDTAAFYFAGHGVEWRSAAQPASGAAPAACPVSFNTVPTPTPSSRAILRTPTPRARIART